MTLAEVIDAAVKVFVGVGGCAAFWAFLQSARERKAPKPVPAGEGTTDMDIMKLGRQELREDYQECRTSLNSMRGAAEPFLWLWDQLAARFVPLGGGSVTVTIDAAELSEIRGAASDLRSHLN